MGQKRKRASEDEGNASLSSAIPAEATDTVGDKRSSKKKQPRSLFIRSLPSTTTTEDIVKHFSHSYPIKHATAITDPETGSCKGYGFVTFADADDAERALEEFNGSSFEGKKITVEIAKPRQRDSEILPIDSEQFASTELKEASVHPGQPAKVQPAQTKLIIRNLPWSIKKPEQLSDLFRSYGKIKSATIPTKKPGLLQGFGFVVLRGRKNAEKALEGVNGKTIDGRTLAVDWAVDKDTWHSQMSEIEKGMVAPEKATNGAQDEESDAPNELLESSDATASGSERGSEFEEDEDEDEYDDENEEGEEQEDHSSTLFIRNVSFDTTDEDLRAHFAHFGHVRYARVVMDPTTERSKGTAFVCFVNQEDARSCLRKAPKTSRSAQSSKSTSSDNQHGPSILENLSLDPTGAYTLDSRVLQVSQAVDRASANRLASESFDNRSKRDNDKRRLYLLSEGTIPANASLHSTLSATEIAMREASAKQRRSLLQSNPSLNLSLTRLSVRNLPRSIGSKELKALAREAVVGFAKDVKEGIREKLSKEELGRGSDSMSEAEKLRRTKGVGIVKQAKVVFEGREGGKVDEQSGAGRSRGYGFIEYYSHRTALMGLRWLNGHAVGYQAQEQGKGNKQEMQDRKKRLIVEFAIENAQVVHRRSDREKQSREKKPDARKETEKKREINGANEKRLFSTLEGEEKSGDGGGNDGGRSNGTKKIKGSKGEKLGKTEKDTKQASRARIIMKKRAARRERKKAQT